MKECGAKCVVLVTICLKWYDIIVVLSGIIGIRKW
jgi:hypothetical protein